MAKVINTVLSLKDDFSSTISKVQKNADRAAGRISKAMAKAETPTQKLSLGFKAVGKEVTQMGKAFMPMSLAVGGALAACVKSAADFEQAMANTWSIAQAGNAGSEEAFNKLSEAAKAAGRQGFYSATEAADALGYMALAGWDAEKSAKALPDVLNLAAAASMDLASASDMVTDYMSAFSKTSMTTTEFTDMLAYAQNNANTTVDALGEAFKNSAAKMNLAGQDAKTVTAILSAMANQGTKGSEAGTKLSAVMRDMTSKMQDGKIAIGDTAIEVANADGSFRQLTDVLVDVEEATAGMSEVERDAALRAVFTADSIDAVGEVLTDGARKTRDFAAALGDAAGYAEDSAKTKYSTLSGSVTMLKNKFNELSVEIGDRHIPYMTALAEAVDRISEKVSGMSDKQKDTLASVALIVAAAGPILVITGTVISAIGTIIGAVSSVVGAISSAVGFITPIVAGLGGVFAAVGTAIAGFFASIAAALSVPVVVVVGIMAAIAGLIAFLIIKRDTVVALLQQGWADIKRDVALIGSEITAAISAVVKVFSKAWSDVKRDVGIITAAIRTAFTSALNAVKTAVAAVGAAFTAAGNVIKNAINGAKNAVSSAVDAIKNKFDSLKTKASSVADSVRTKLSGITDKLGAAIGFNATGTSYWTGGPTMVNEHGGEIINLPSGTQIIPHDLSKQKLKDSGPRVVVNLTVQGNMIGNREYADELGGIIAGRLVAALGNS